MNTTNNQIAILREAARAFMNLNSTPNYMALDQAIKATEFAATQPAGDAVATVIKRGADRQWMSEALGTLPDGTYSLYLAPPAPVQAVADAVKMDRQYLAGYDAGFMAGEMKDYDRRNAVHAARDKAIREAIAAPAVQAAPVGSIGDDAEFQNLARSIAWTRSVDGQVKRLVAYIDARSSTFKKEAK